MEHNIQRAYRLAALALQGVDFPECEIDDGQLSSKTRHEPLGLHRVEDKFYVYAEERGIRSGHAVFKDDHLAANYFAWVVSKGQRFVDWALHFGTHSWAPEQS